MLLIKKIAIKKNCVYYIVSHYVDGRDFHLFPHRRHWDEFFQQSDIEALAAAGISHVRIPYGYWMVDVQAGLSTSLELNFLFSFS